MLETEENYHQQRAAPRSIDPAQRGALCENDLSLKLLLIILLDGGTLWSTRQKKCKTWGRSVISTTGKLNSVPSKFVFRKTRWNWPHTYGTLDARSSGLKFSSSRLKLKYPFWQSNPSQTRKYLEQDVVLVAWSSVWSESTRRTLWSKAWTISTSGTCRSSFCNWLFYSKYGWNADYLE